MSAFKKIKHFRVNPLILALEVGILPKKVNRSDLGSNAFWLASHMVQGSSSFCGTESAYSKCSSTVLLSMMSFNLQR